jgi:hypothetical protein
MGEVPPDGLWLWSNGCGGMVSRIMATAQEARIPVRIMNPHNEPLEISLWSTTWESFTAFRPWGVKMLAEPMNSWRNMNLNPKYRTGNLRNIKKMDFPLST